jgi:hypothetical protein
MPKCAYCDQESEHTCYACDRPICSEHTHRASLSDYEVGDSFCQPAGDDTIAIYRRTGRTPECGEVIAR